MIHPEQAGVKKATIKAEIAKKFKASEDRVAIFGLRAKYGGGRSSCFASIYDDVDTRKKYDTKTNIYRVSDANSSNVVTTRQVPSSDDDCSNGAFVFFQLQ